jgi:hypothetical protein
VSPLTSDKRVDDARLSRARLRSDELASIFQTSRAKKSNDPAAAHAVRQKFVSG